MKRLEKTLRAYLFPSPALSIAIACWLIGYWTASLCVCARERAASRAGPEADNMGDGAERKLPGQTGAAALGEQRGETQEYLLEVIVIAQFLNKITNLSLF